MHPYIGVALKLCFVNEVVARLSRLIGVAPGSLSDVCKLIAACVGLPDPGLLPGKGDQKPLVIFEQVPEKRFWPRKMAYNVLAFSSRSGGPGSLILRPTELFAYPSSGQSKASRHRLQAKSVYRRRFCGKYLRFMLI
jgi:hypothetical protein